MEDANATRVLIVDDHEVVRLGYAKLLSRETDITICGDAADSPSAMKLLFDTRPDLVLVDLSLPSGHGLELCKQIQSMNEHQNWSVKMLVVSAHDEELYAERALNSGALGYLNKRDSAKHLLKAIRRVAEGKIFLSPAITERVLSRVMNGRSEVRSALETLSDRELEVYELIGQGKTTRQVAEVLDLSPKTIETYREALKRKLNLENSSQLVRAAAHFVLEGG